MTGIYETKPATYVEYPGRRYRGNPLIEALPVWHMKLPDLLNLFNRLPARPTAADRKMDALIRIDEVNTLKNVVYARPDYQRAAVSLLSNIKDAYYARNPLTATDARRRELIARARNELTLPDELQMTACGQGLFGVSGSGKSTFCNTFSLALNLRQVIVHSNYKGEIFHAHQIPWVSIRIPHDATLKSLCIQFFERVDAICGNTSWAKEGRKRGGIAEMALLIAKVATSVSLGVLFVDEFQNLRIARGPQIEFVLNMFSQIIEVAGVCVLVAGTPAIEDFLDKNIRNIRKIVSGGETRLEPMNLGTVEFDAFCNVYWDYQWVKNSTSLSPAIRKAWYRASGGNPAFIVMAFMLAQRHAIGGREIVDEIEFEGVLRTGMVLLAPAINALRSRNKQILRQFDDLIFTNKYEKLRALVGWSGAADADGDGDAKRAPDPSDEFSEILDSEAASGKSPRQSGKQGKKPELQPFEFEDPMKL